MKKIIRLRGVIASFASSPSSTLEGNIKEKSKELPLPPLFLLTVIGQLLPPLPHIDNENCMIFATCKHSFSHEQQTTADYASKSHCGREILSVIIFDVICYFTPSSTDIDMVVGIIKF